MSNPCIVIVGFNHKGIPKWKLIEVSTRDNAENLVRDMQACFSDLEKIFITNIIAYPEKKDYASEK